MDIRCKSKSSPSKVMTLLSKPPKSCVVTTNIPDFMLLLHVNQLKDVLSITKRAFITKLKQVQYKRTCISNAISDIEIELLYHEKKLQLVEEKLVSLYLLSMF